MSSQVDKFKNKWGKNEQDLEAIKKAELKKQQQVSDEHGGLENVDQFKSQTGLKEVVAGFTAEGMKVFSEMFSNTIKSTIANEISPMLKEVLQEVVREQLAEVIQMGTESLKEYSKLMLKEQIKETFKPINIEPQEIVKSIIPAIITENEIFKKPEEVKVKPRKPRRESPRKLHKTEETLKALVKLIKQHGGEIRSSVAIEEMRKKGYGFANGSSALNRVLKDNKYIKREYGLLKLNDKVSAEG